MITALVALSIVCTAGTARTQGPIPVRTVRVEATTDSGLFNNIGAVRHLPDGRVLVNDPSRRRLLMLARDFRSFRVLADTAAGAPHRYPGTFVNLIRYVGDSSILVDRDASAFVVIDPEGRFGRVMAPPKASDVPSLLVPYCACGFDPRGRLVYRGRRNTSTNPELPPDGANRPIAITQPDSAPLVRADPDTRRVDTIGMMRIPDVKAVGISPQPGHVSFSVAFNPLPQTDEWVLLPDGTVAIVRSQDYHIDWIAPDGQVTSTPKMPFDWKQISHEQKAALLDSVKQAAVRRAAAAPPPPVSARGAPPPVSRPFLTVEPEDMADYYPPVRQGQIRADPEGRVWILPSTSALGGGTSGGLVWDVVDRAGQIVERIKLPAGRNLAVVGPDGIVYMIYAPGPGRVLLERGVIE